MKSPVDLSKAYRLLNHGPTVLVSTAHGNQRNVMAAAWNMALDFEPPKIAVVIDKNTYTRELVEASGNFSINVPSRMQAAMVVKVGSSSGRELLGKQPDNKFAAFDMPTMPASKIDAPLIVGCVGWLECKVIPEPHNQQTYDLFIGEVVAAYADSRVFRNGHWEFETADPRWRSLHYIAGGQFYAIGESAVVKTT